MLEKGNSQKLAHISRTHRVNLHWISEVLKSEDVAMAYIKSADQAADIFTKAFLVPQVWKDLCALINQFSPDNAPLRSNLPVQCCSPNQSCNLACVAALPMPTPESRNDPGRSAGRPVPYWDNSSSSGSGGRPPPPPLPAPEPEAGKEKTSIWSAATEAAWPAAAAANNPVSYTHLTLPTKA